MVVERLTTTSTPPELRRLELARRRLDADLLEVIAAAEAVSQLTGAPMVRPLRLLSTKQVADRLGASEVFVKNLLANGQLARLKVGKLTRVQESELERFIGECSE